MSFDAEMNVAKLMEEMKMASVVLRQEDYLS